MQQSANTSAVLLSAAPRVCGHSLTFFDKNDGPCHHSSEFLSLFTAKPRESRSAGFSTVGTCRQLNDSVSCCISAIRFNTNTCDVLECVCSQLKTIVESVQQVTSSNDIFNACTILATRRARRRAAQSSNRGIVCCLRGATLFFAHNNDT